VSGSQFFSETNLAISEWGPLNGASDAGWSKKIAFSTNISLYLGNNTRQGHRYYGTVTGSRMRPIKPMILDDR